MEFETFDFTRAVEFKLIRCFFLSLQGWGHLQQDSIRMSDILHQVQVPIIDNVECKEKYQNIFRFRTIPDIRLNETSVFCAGYPAGGRDA